MPAVKVPATLGECADRLFKIKGEKAKLRAEVDRLEEEEKVLNAHVIKTLPMSKAEGVTGRFGRITIVHKEVPTAEAWPKIYAYILKTKDFSIMQRRLLDSAIFERWENKQKVPGVKAFGVKKVSVTKR